MHYMIRRSMIPQIFRFSLLLSVLVLAITPISGVRGESSIVSISKNPEGNFTLLRDGKPFYINGAGGTSRLEMLVKCGGNSVRTWGIDSLEEMVDGKRLIDRAQELGLAVTAGIWIGHDTTALIIPTNLSCKNSATPCARPCANTRIPRLS